MTAEELWTILLVTGIGLIVGIVAKFAAPGDYSKGFIVNMLIGVAGALGMFWIGYQAGWYELGHKRGIIVAVAGAVIAHLLEFNRRLKLKQRRERDHNQRHWN
jgi:uncharacterized membrane protein YeaQ/YmgE (transglycosylase-associated protein family)